MAVAAKRERVVRVAVGGSGGRTLEVTDEDYRVGLAVPPEDVSNPPRIAHSGKDRGGGRADENIPTIVAEAGREAIVHHCGGR